MLFLNNLKLHRQTLESLREAGNGAEISKANAAAEGTLADYKSAAATLRKVL